MQNAGKQNAVRRSLRVVNAVGLAAVVLLLTLTAAFGIIPMYRSGQQDIRAAREKEAARERIETLRANVQDARQQEDASQRRLQAAEIRIPLGPPDSAFSKELNEVANVAGIRVESTPPMARPVVAGAYKAVAVSVEGSGTWESCMRFLRGISNMERLARLDSVTVDDRGGMATGSTNPTLHILVKFSTFYREH
jgi:Tfp pilus assembly protein PilO